MAHVNWLIGGLALAMVLILHWLLLSRMMAVSGRVTALMRLLFERSPNNAEGDEGVDEAPMTAEEMAEALREATADAFGEDALEEMSTGPAPVMREPWPVSAHLGFLVAMVVGGTISALISGSFSFDLLLADPSFKQHFGDGATALSVLFGGGLLVGFGSRMAGGCNTGHGLCGTSRFQSGSTLSTAAVYVAGILTAFILTELL